MCIWEFAKHVRSCLRIVAPVLQTFHARRATLAPFWMLENALIAKMPSKTVVYVLIKARAHIVMTPLF